MYRDRFSPFLYPEGPKFGKRKVSKNAPRREEENDPCGETIGAEMAKRMRRWHASDRRIWNMRRWHTSDRRIWNRIDISCFSPLPAIRSVACLDLSEPRSLKGKGSSSFMEYFIAWFSQRNYCKSLVFFYFRQRQCIKLHWFNSSNTLHNYGSPATCISTCSARCARYCTCFRGISSIVRFKVSFVIA